MKKSILLVCMTLVVLTASAQFEKKLTAQFSLGYAIPTGDLSTYFSSGLTVDGGVQYNFSRQFGLVALLKYNTFFFKETVGVDGKFNNLGISFCPKYTFSTGKTRPYVFGGPSINFLKFQFGSFGDETSTSFGYTLGGGVEFGINENFSWFSQLGINNIVDEGETFTSTFIQVGVNINMFKAKSL